MTRMFRAVLLHDDAVRDHAVLVPTAGSTAPIVLRIPALYAGAAAYDVYELDDDDGWPDQAIYDHTGLIPRTTTDTDERP
ncbi:hypothetical protein ACIRCZ_18525 [Leifsonia sp. NPDC102414]|uniref:hypothetical protein n=1 Tax=Leifsonia sp. NPDC102414 TaxID=3364124 RepID=UPI00381DA5E0